jgi:hypothetical protein
MSRPHHRYYSSIDGLRAMCVALVILAKLVVSLLRLFFYAKRVKLAVSISGASMFAVSSVSCRFIR